ncbi:MAG: TIGR00730 family Rossman fold protein, partial [Rhodospirillaceae bacterium]|nr:TIGR00730 family Rossman fold protein [Rhodospirillaceae bacterium]
TNLEVVTSMHERKARMAELSNAFIVLPGGLGTLEELFEIMTWRQLGLHDKPIVVINPDGHWDRLRGLIDDLVTAGYARPENAGLVHFVADPAAALAKLESQLTGETHIETGCL